MGFICRRFKTAGIASKLFSNLFSNDGGK